MSLTTNYLEAKCVQCGHKMKHHDLSRDRPDNKACYCCEICFPPSNNTTKINTDLDIGDLSSGGDSDVKEKQTRKGANTPRF